MKPSSHPYSYSQKSARRAMPLLAIALPLPLPIYPPVWPGRRIVPPSSEYPRIPLHLGRPSHAPVPFRVQ